MNRRRSHWHREVELLNTLERAAAPRRRASLPGLIWTWRKELALLMSATILFIVMANMLGITWAIAGISAMIGAFSPPWSEQLKAFGWQLITPHLLRSGMYHARIQNRNGRQPVIIRITCEPFGERVRLRCPAGTSAEDLFAARELLRAACRAADVRVTRDKQRSHIVTVDIIRHLGHIETTEGG